MLAVIDYGAGNLRSVLHALNHLGVDDIRLVREPADLAGAEKIILPGVGAFGAGMGQLHQQDLVAPLKDAVARGVPYLGICLGMQFLFERSDEMGDHAGLGILPGLVTRIPERPGLKVPHMGWNQLRAFRPSPLLAGLADEGANHSAYFVHSYHCVPADAADVLAVVDYGDPIVVAVQRDQVYGVQFHPEKSQKTGLTLLTQFPAFACALRGASMIIYPAIDLRGGKVVRLKEGDPNRQTTFSDDPVATAQKWIDEGASWLHVVNLDGAFETANENGAITEKIAKLNVSVQFGGGLRSLEASGTAIERGVSRVVIGTAAITQPEIVADSLAKFGSDAVCIALDAKEGKIATHGWQQTSELTPIDFGRQIAHQGVIHALYTDVRRDGGLIGANVHDTIMLGRDTGLSVIASGGVTSAEEINLLARSQVVGGVVIGMALYEDKLTLIEALMAAKTPGEAQ